MKSLNEERDKVRIFVLIDLEQIHCAWLCLSHRFCPWQGLSAGVAFRAGTSQENSRQPTRMFFLFVASTFTWTQLLHVPRFLPSRTFSYFHNQIVGWQDLKKNRLR